METFNTYILEDGMKIKEAPDCPYCKVKMKKCIPPSFSVGEGLGWCVDYFYVCFNNECRLYVSGWENISENYGKTASYRCICYPDSGLMEAMCVFSPDGFTGQIVEE